MEDVVEGDDEALPLQEQILHDHNQGMIAPEPAEVIDLNAPQVWTCLLLLLPLMNLKVLVLTMREIPW
jgi:hypothetical protein